MRNKNGLYPLLLPNLGRNVAGSFSYMDLTPFTFYNNTDHTKIFKETAEPGQGVYQCSKGPGPPRGEGGAVAAK